MNEQQLHDWRALIRVRGGGRAFRVEDNARIARTLRLQWHASRPSLAVPTTLAERHRQLRWLIESRRPTR
jgi:hypothetical protein